MHHARRPGARDTPVEGVSSLSYSPKPFYNDLSYMKVRLTTVGRAALGREYVVTLISGGKHAGECASAAVSDEPRLGGSRKRITGSAGGTYTVWLRAIELDGGFFCAGPAYLIIDTEQINSTKGARVLRKLTFRILRAP